MQTQLATFVRKYPEAPEMEAIIRDCVHCGFCLATCPTYQVLGNELDSPRGRIYLLKQVLEGNPVSRLTQQHLDRCLNCRACETTCPSGVDYGRLLDFGRIVVDSTVARPWREQLLRELIIRIFPYSRRFSWLMRVARSIRPVLPAALKQKISPGQKIDSWPAPRHQRKVLIFSGCVQPVLAPTIDVVAARVLDRLGISLIRIEAGGCCGALNYHLSDRQGAETFARNNIDACWSLIDQNVEAILMTASGCSVMVKDYGQLLQFDPEYAEKAEKVSALAKDISEIVAAEDLSLFNAKPAYQVAFQSPCTLQHGQRINGLVENILEQTGYTLTPVDNGHLCCGSAGVYSLLQPALSGKLLTGKLEDLEVEAPDIIATANIGCLSHLKSQSKTRVVHWIELLA